MDKKGVFAILLILVSILSGCATTTPEAKLTPGAEGIQIGLKSPPRKACEYLGPLQSIYKQGVLGVKNNQQVNHMRHQATILLMNQAYALGANYVYVKREDAEIAGAFNYQSARSVMIEADAFNCGSAFMQSLSN